MSKLPVMTTSPALPSLLCQFNGYPYTLDEDWQQAILKGIDHFFHGVMAMFLKRSINIRSINIKGAWSLSYFKDNAKSQHINNCLEVAN